MTPYHITFFEEDNNIIDDFSQDFETDAQAIVYAEKIVQNSDTIVDFSVEPWEAGFIAR